MTRERLTLRPVREDDWETIYEWARLEETSRYQAWGPNSEEDTREFVSLAVQDAQREPQSRFVMVAVTDDDTIRGQAEVNVVSRRWRCADIGYAVHHAFRRRGYGTRIAGLSVDFAFRELEMHRVQATCDPRNVGSGKVLQRIGMVREGTLRHMMELTDGWRDSDLYSVLEHEWSAR